VPATVLMTPNGKTLNVGDWDSGTVTPICTAANTALPAIRVAPPHGLDTAFAITPDGRTLYVDGGFGGSNRGFIVPVSTATGAGGRPILASGQPGVMAFTPNGMTLYVLPSGHPGPQDIIPVNTATNTAGPAIHTGLSPDAIAITLPGARRPRDRRAARSAPTATRTGPAPSAPGPLNALTN